METSPAAGGLTSRTLVGRGVMRPQLARAPTVVKLRPPSRLKELVLPTVSRPVSAAKLEFEPLRVTFAPAREVILEPGAKLRFELGPTIQVPPVREFPESCATAPVMVSVLLVRVTLPALLRLLVTFRVPLHRTTLPAF